MKTPFPITIIDCNSFFIEAAREAFAGVEGLSFWTGNVRDFTIKPVTAFVSPANSLGFMDGGIDAAYMMMFPGIQEKVRSAIRKLGMETALGRPFLPISSAIIVNADGPEIALISAPTMFLPQSVVGTRNAYHAFTASLCMFEKSGLSGHLVCPALCTGYGRMPVDESTKQMYEALRDFIEGKRPAENPKYKNIKWCFIGPNVDHEQNSTYENREIQELPRVH